jgi:hypothetical protein
MLTVISTFYIRGLLQERSEYGKLREKLESIAGKNAMIVYEGVSSVGDTLYKITDFGKNGITIENSFHKVFIPAGKVLQMEIVLPVDDYKERKDAFEKQQIEKVSKALFEPLMEQMKENFEKELERPDGELSGPLRSSVIVLLEEKGLLVPNDTVEAIEHDK